MILRITLFQLRPDVSEYETRVLLATVGGAVKNIPGLLMFKVGRRVSREGAYRLGAAAADRQHPDYDYAAVFQFESRAALDEYLRHPAQAQLRSRLEAVVLAATTSDYEV
jgi:hypothetical protein